MLRMEADNIIEKLQEILLEWEGLNLKYCLEQYGGSIKRAIAALKLQEKIRSRESAYRNSLDKQTAITFGLAKEEIERLEMELQGFQKWIKCEDELPNDEQQVMIFADNEYFIVKYFKNWPLMGGRCFVGEACYFISDIDKVTHWMPLPEPPRNGGGE